MSKEAAMAMATGQPVTSVNPSLVTGPIGEAANPALSPGVAPTPLEAVKDVLDSDRFALLAKKESKFVREREEFNKEKAQVLEQKAKLTAEFEKIKAFMEKQKVDPVGALKDIGFSETDLFNFMAAAEKKEPTVEEIASQVVEQRLAKEKEEQAKVAEEARKAQEQGLVTKYTAQISEAFKANPEKYEYSNHYGKVAEELALEFAAENARMNGELLSPQEVADAIEEYYEEQDKAMSALKKRQPKIEASVTDEAKVEPARTRTVSPPVGTPPMPSKTLTNKATATVASTVARRETHEQKKQRLIDSLKAGTYRPTG